MDIQVLLPNKTNGNLSTNHRGIIKEKVHSFLNTVLAHDTIITFLKNFPSSSQHVSSIYPIIKKQPNKELNLWYTLGFPNPKN
jgi:hypothetical protein